MSSIPADFTLVTSHPANWRGTLRRLLRRQSLLRYHRRIHRQRTLARLLANSDERMRRDLGIDLAEVRRHDWLLDLARR